MPRLRTVVIRPTSLPVKRIHHRHAALSVTFPSSANSRNATSSGPGNSLPRADARRKIPLAARAESAYRRSGLPTRMSDNEHSTAALGNSEEPSVEYPPRQAIPEVGQRPEDGPEVSPVTSG